LEASSFMLELVQTGDKVEGYHNSVTNGGRRLDTVLKDDGIPSVSGTVTNGVATVKFKSGYGNGTGEAVMKIVKGELDWTIKNSKGEHYFPQECVMEKLKEKKK
jgi:hypothetical protein